MKRPFSSIFSLLFVAVSLSFCSTVALAQARQGELQLHITDSAGAALRATVHIVSQGNQYTNVLSTDLRGSLDAQHLPFGLYRIEITRSGFAPLTRSVEIRSNIPVTQTIALSV